MDWSKLFEYLPSSKTMANIGQAVSPLISGYSAIKQAGVMKETNNLLLKNYEYNKSINNREIAKENMNQDNAVSGFASVFGNGNKKKKSLDAYAGMTNYQG